MASSALALRLLFSTNVTTARINNNTPVIAPTIVPIKAALSRPLLPPDAGVVVELELEDTVALPDEDIETDIGRVEVDKVIVIELADGTEEGAWMEKESPVSCCPVSWSQISILYPPSGIKEVETFQSQLPLFLIP